MQLCHHFKYLLISIHKKIALVFISPGPFFRPVSQNVLCYAAPTAAFETRVPFLRNKTRIMFLHSFILDNSCIIINIIKEALLESLTIKLKIIDTVREK